MSTPAPLSPDHLGSPEGIADPYPAYRAFRDVSPVRYVRTRAGFVPGTDAPLHSWAVLRHADLLAAVRDPATFSSRSAPFNKLVPKLPLLHDDDPHHGHLRRLLTKAFSPRRIATLEGWVGGIAGELIDAMGQETAEVMEAYAGALPTRVIAGLLGVPEEDYPDFRRWSEAAVAYAGMAPAERASKMQQMAAYLGEAIAARRAQGRDDLITAMLEAEVEGARLDDGEARALCTTLLVAGNETTTNLLGNMLAILADRPELWRQAREDRALVEPIIEETLRYESPVQRFPRVTTRPVEIAGVQLGEGELVDLFFGAANRDPAVFSDPDTFRLDRPAGDHVAFGQGVHYCIGASLARLEAKVTLNAFLDRFEEIRRGDEPAVRQSSAPVGLGYKRLPLVLGSRG